MWSVTDEFQWRYWPYIQLSCYKLISIPNAERTVQVTLRFSVLSLIWNVRGKMRRCFAHSLTHGGHFFPLIFKFNIKLLFRLVNEFPPSPTAKEMCFSFICLIYCEADCWPGFTAALYWWIHPWSFKKKLFSVTFWMPVVKAERETTWELFV